MLASAGHPPALHVTADGGVTEVPTPGPLLGAFADSEWQAETLAVAPGELVLLYTDGVTETASESGERYGVDRLQPVPVGTRGIAGRSRCWTRSMRRLICSVAARRPTTSRRWRWPHATTDQAAAGGRCASAPVEHDERDGVAGAALRNRQLVGEHRQRRRRAGIEQSAAPAAKRAERQR